MANSNTSLSALQQRITALKAHNTATNLTGELTDYTNDKIWLTKIAEEGNKPEDWLEYLKVIDQRGTNNMSNVMYNKAIRDIPVYKYKKDENYATILINSARLRATQDVDEARTLFKFARANIRFLARIHVAAAQLELDIGDRFKCRSVLCKGIEVGAVPVELLKTALARLEAGETLLNPEADKLFVSNVTVTTHNQQRKASSNTTELFRSASQDHSEDSTNTASYLQVDPTISFKKRQRNPSDNRTEDTATMLRRQALLSHSATKQTCGTPSQRSLTLGTHKMRKISNSSTSLSALQQRISALKGNNTSTNLTGELTDYTNDKIWLAKIAEDGNKPEDWLEYLKVIDQRGADNTSSLNVMYNKAIHDIPVYKHKKNDSYVTILINSARLRAAQDVDEARTLFKFARANIRFLARIHVAAAQLELDIGDGVKCRNVLCKGIEIGAAPVELLKTALVRLEAGETLLNPQDNALIISDVALKASNQQTTVPSTNMQMNSSGDTDTTFGRRRQKHLSQSATKQPCITPLSKPPVTSASTAGKNKMRLLGAPMRVKRAVMPNLQEDVADDDQPLLYGIAPLNDRHSSRSDSSDNTDTSLHNTFPSLTLSMLARSEVEKDPAKMQTSCKVFTSPIGTSLDNHHASMAENDLQVAHISTPEFQEVIAAPKIDTPRPFPTQSITPVSATVSTVTHIAPSPAAVVAPAPFVSPPPVITSASFVFPPPAVTSATFVSPPPVVSLCPVFSTPSVITSATVISPPPVITPTPVISPPVITRPPAVEPPAPVHSVPAAPVMQANIPQPQLRMQPQTQADQSKNVIYVNNKQYTVLKLVGKGGSSKVYQVYSADLKNVLAIKRVDLELADDLTKQGYINEITLLTQLQKKTEKIIKLYDFELTDSFIVMVMECGSIDLSTFLRRNKNISEDKIRFYWREMLEAVNVIHQQGIVHSDLKPANFLFVEATLKLIDFGIANAIQVDQTSVLRDQQIGTLNYMSPEAIQDTSPPPPIDSTGRRKPRLKINCRSDVWSLGCILYYMVYGRTPFQHITNGLMKLQAIIDPNHAIHFPVISNKDLHDVLQKCLIRNPKERPSIDTLLEHPFLMNRTQDELAGSTDSGTCKLSANQLQALISQLSTVRVHSPRSISAISNAKVLIEQLQKGSSIPEVSTEIDQPIVGGMEMGPPMSAGISLCQPPTKQARMACRQPLQSVNIVDIQKAQGNGKQTVVKHRHETDKENFGMVNQ